MIKVLNYLIPAVMLILISLPLIPVYRGRRTGTKAKNSIIFNLCAFFGFAALMVFLPIGQLFVAAETAAATAETTAAVVSAAQYTLGSGLGFVAAALATGMSAIGAGIAVAAAAPAAIGATSEDSKVFGKALIFVALGEGVALYGLLISILIINKL